MPETHHSSTQDVSSKRLLFFFNHIRYAKDLRGSYLVSDIDSETYEDRSQALSRNILETRMQLPARKFTQVDQLLEIPGISSVTLGELQNFLGQSAAELFKQDMYKQVILSNFECAYQKITFEERALFEATTGDRTALSEAVAAHLVLESIGPLSEVEIRRQIRHSYVDAYTQGHLGSFALALWFYTFALDNWFSFEQVRESTEKYLDVHPLSSDTQTLYLFKGFDNKLLVSGGRTVPDLPVIVNHDEMTVAIWTCLLKD
ncbi:MAG: hypothetical protein AAF694_05180 [Bacteroidota bacterium]